MRKRRRDKLPYAGRVPLPLGNPGVAERLAKVEALVVVGRELTEDESRIAVALAHLFVAAIIDRDDLIEQLQDKLMDVVRRWA